LTLPSSRDYLRASLVKRLRPRQGGAASPRGSWTDEPLSAARPAPAGGGIPAGSPPPGQGGPGSRGFLKENALRGQYQDFRRNWLTLGVYERFEQLIALVLAGLIAVIVVVAVWDLAKRVVLLALNDRLDPLDHRTFQALFGQILTVLIALEFKHSIVKVVAAAESIIQVRTVLLIALLALSRKLIILDSGVTSPVTIFALAAVLLALGVAYWLVRDQDAKHAARG
jgi:uncharacterized membrane protein (DUF373 family)